MSVWRWLLLVRLRKSTFRYIENEIYDHSDTRQALFDLEEDIILSTPPHQEIRTKDPTDPTGLTASMLATNKIRKRMHETVYAIDIAFIQIAPEQRDVLEDKYWARPHLRWIDVALYHNLDKSTVYRWRTDFVQDVAKRLGLY
jgi:RinA family phage transcriptional activator